jgi:amino acid transporter
MRNKNLNLFIVAFAVITTIASFVENKSTTDLFGFEVNSWLVRILWLLIGLVSYKRYKDKKEEEAN